MTEEMRIGAGLIEARVWAARVQAGLVSAGLSVSTKEHVRGNAKNAEVKLQVDDPTTQLRVGTVEVRAIEDKYRYRYNGRVMLELAVPYSLRRRGTKSTLLWKKFSDVAIGKIVERCKDLRKDLIEDQKRRQAAEDLSKRNRDNGTKLADAVAKIGFKVDKRQWSTSFEVFYSEQRGDVFEVTVEGECIQLRLAHACVFTLMAMPVTDHTYCAVAIERFVEKLRDLKASGAVPGARGR